MSEPPGAPVAPSIPLQDGDWPLDRLLRLLRIPGGRSGERDRALVLSVSTSFVAQGVTTLVGIASLPIALHYLGRQTFGLWAAVTSLVVWGSLLDLGIARGLMNALAEAHGQDDEASARSYVCTALIALTTLAVGLGLLAVAVVPHVDWAGLFGVHGIPAGEVRRSVAAAIAAFLVGLPLGLVQQVYAAYQRLYVANLFLVASSVATLVALLLATVLGASLPVLILVLGLTGQVVTLLSLGVLTRRILPWLRIRPGYVSRAAAARLRKSSVPLLCFQVGALLVNETQVVILSRRTNLTLVGDYAVLMRFYIAIASFIALASAAFAPAFREAYERGDTFWLRRGFTRMLAFRMALSLVGAVVFVLAGNAILRIWVGRSVSAGHSVWFALAVLLLAATWVTGFSDLLAVLDRIWVQVALVVLNGVVVAAGTYVLAPSHHLVGAFVATAATSVLVLSWLMPLLARPLLRGRAT